MSRFTLVLAFVAPVSVYGQRDNEVNPETIMENQLTVMDEEGEDPETAENYAQWLAHPVDLNRASRDQLRLLGLLSDDQIENLIAHRTKNGDLVSIYELQTIEGFDTETTRQLARIARVIEPGQRIDKALFRRMITDGEHYVMVRYDYAIQQKKGFKDEREDVRFIGSPGRILVRVRSFRPGDYSFGITAEKDAGESVAWKPGLRQFGMDHYAWHLQLSGKGRLSNIVAGNFSAQFGQGLVWGGGLGFGKGAETITSARRPGVGFVPYTSAYEGGSLNGLAATFAINKHFAISGLYSSSRRDGSIADEDSTAVSSIGTTGLHRNRAELGRRKKVQETVMGSVLTYANRRIQAGIAFQHIRFAAPLSPREFLYNHFTFRGSRNTNASIFAGYNWNSISFFVESAQTLGQGSASVAGALMSVSANVDISLLYRNYRPDYQPVWATAFSENTKPQNETGLYWGWKYRHGKKIQVAGYFDLFRFNALKFRTYAPSAGHEWLVRVQWQPSRVASAFFQVREEMKSRNLSPPEGMLYTLEPVRKRNFSINFDYQPSILLRMRTRLQFSTMTRQTQFSSGNVIAQDIVWRTGKFRWTARYALFDTQDYDNRQYLYEHDVWLSYAMPAYNGTGVRRYILIQYALNKTWTFWLRFGATRYENIDSIGSGVDQIAGNVQNDVKFEVRVRL